MNDGLRVLVCGGRDYADKRRIEEVLNLIQRHRGPFALVIHGDAGHEDQWGVPFAGADKLAGRWAKRRGVEVKACPYKRELGRAGGPARNRQMLVEGKPDLVVAFPGAKGTENMVRQARAGGVEVIEIVDATSIDLQLIEKSG